MFDGLDDIDWSQLIHAYGAATDVPGDIRALVSADEKVAKDALWRLLGNIYHQGTRYTATAPAIPYLVEAALAVAPQRAARIVELLGAIVEPAADIFLRDGLTVAGFRAVIAEEEARMSAQARAEYAEYGTWPRVETEVYDAVLDQIPRLLSGLDRTSAEIQVSLLELLGYFPDQRNAVEKLTAEIFADPNAGDVLQVAAIECLETLGRSIDIPPYDAVFEELITPDNSLFVRSHAAAAMTTQTDARFVQMLDALKNADEIYRLDRHYARGGGWSMTDVLLGLRPWYATHKEQICDAMIESLPAAQRTGADTSTIVHSLVIALAHPSPTGDYFKAKRAKDLTVLEKRALESIVTYGTWKIGDTWLGNFKSLIASFGLPDRPETLKRYIHADQSFLSRFLKR